MKDTKDCTALLVCEGEDCAHFFIQVINKLGNINKIYVIDVGGIKDKTKFINVKDRSDFSQYDTIIYARDAEYPVSNISDKVHYKSVIDTIKERFKSIGLCAPDRPLELSETADKKCGYIILSGNPVLNPETKLPYSLTGTLEDLCISIAVDDEAVTDSKAAIDNINKKRNNKINDYIHKRYFHCYLAFNKNKELVGALSGQAVKIGAFDLEHSNFKPIVNFLEIVENSK
jgi:hypothetical protein